jgi:hypothetical protein
MIVQGAAGRTVKITLCVLPGATLPGARGEGMREKEKGQRGRGNG